MWTMWNSEFPQNPHDPDTVLCNGKRDIATVSYPLTGEYDSSDIDLLEYQILLMKISGIDGVIVDWDGRYVNSYRHEILMGLLPTIEKYGLEVMICFEEWAGYWPIGAFENRQDEIDAAKEEMKWLMENIASRPCYTTIDGEKPVLIFRKIEEKLFSKDEFIGITELAESNDGLIIYPQLGEEYVPEVSHGTYFWIGNFDESGYNSIQNGLDDYEAFCKKCQNLPSRRSKAFNIGCVCPGFDDTPVWGWGTSPHVAPREAGNRYNKMWELSIKYDMDAVQILTWNDWNEGSQIEPSDTYGYEYILSTKKYVARYKQIDDNIPDDLFEKVLKLYKMRKNADVTKEHADQLLSEILRYVEKVE